MQKPDHTHTTSGASGPPRSGRGVLWASRLVLLLVLLLLIPYVGIALVAAYVLGTPPRRKIVGTPTSVGGIVYDNITFPARVDETPIAAWFLPNHSSTKAIIVVHGKGQCRTCEFSDQAIPFAISLRQQGFNVLMLDLRGHGESGKGIFTFGLRERRDVLGAVDWLRGRGFVAGSIGVLGVSMGAASSIGAAAEEPAIGALVADSSYAEFYPVVKAEFPRESNLPGWFLPPMLAFLRLMNGEDISCARPVAEIGAIAPRPVLLIHAQGDGLIPLAHAHQLKAALPTADLWIVPTEEHAKTYNHDPAGYVQRVATFFHSSLLKNW